MRFRLKCQRQAHLSRSDDTGCPSIFEPSVLRDGPVSCQKPVESLPGGKFFPLLAQKASAFPSPSVRLLGKLELFGTHCFKTLTAERRDQLRLLPESSLPLGWLHEECFAFLSFSICFLLLILGVDDKQRSCNLMIPACKLFVQADTRACCCACVSVRGQPGTVHALLPVWLPRTKCTSFGPAGITLTK